MPHERPANLGAEYWDAVVSGAPAGSQPLWRTHSDAVNIALCRRWWPASPVSRLLKTDLFDEVHGGGLTPFLRERAGTVQGIDCSPEVVRRAARRATGLRTAVADVRRLPFADGAFDLVVSNSTLDHFERREDIAVSLHEIRRVLAPGGHLILTLDNLANPVVALRNALPFRLTHAMRLVPYFVGATCGPWQGARLVADAGLRILDATAVMHCPASWPLAAQTWSSASAARTRVVPSSASRRRSKVWAAGLPATRRATSSRCWRRSPSRPEPIATVGARRRAAAGAFEASPGCPHSERVVARQAFGREHQEKVGG
jgi:SAM-dependent methyltransferase